MNYIDLILILIISLAVFQGWRNGFIDSCIELIIWMGSFLSALFLSDYTARLFYTFFNITDVWIRPLSFILTLIMCSRIIYLLFNKLSDNIPDQVHLHWANKIGGILPGGFSGIIYATLLSFLFLSYPAGDATQKTRESLIAKELTKRPEWLEERFTEIFNEVGQKLSRKLTIHPEGKDLVYLPFKTTDIKVRRDLEIKMLNLINKERKKAGLNQLVFDDELAEVARKHSKDMFARGYFSHYTPEGESPFDRIRKEGIRFRIAGENLALAQSLNLAHEGLMESPVHKANILHRSFGHVGIGILDGGIYGIMATQNFRN